jgi:flagellar basal-body rod protein FlgB
MFGGTFGRNLDIITREMDVAVLRNNVIANNIANSDTPNFKRSYVNFESRLKRALVSEKAAQSPGAGGYDSQGPAISQYITNSRHIPFDRPLHYSSVQPRRVLDYLTVAKNNGNNVDIEQEGMDALTNQLSYTTLAQVISSEIQRVNIVLK